MGQILSIWSPTKKSGKTIFSYCLINRLSDMIKSEHKIAAVCVNLGYGNLTKLFGVSENELNLEDILNLRIKPDNRIEYINALAKKNSIYFMGSRKMSFSYAARHIKQVSGLLEELKEKFDVVIIDTLSGNDNSLTNLILEKSDYIYTVINQDKESLDAHPFKRDNCLSYILNFYREIYPDTKDISSIYNVENIFTLPSCELLQEMKNKEKLEHYLQHETDYTLAVTQIAEYTANQLGLGLERESEQQAGKFSFIKQLLGGKT